MLYTSTADSDGPSLSDLAAIDAEWPLIEAHLAVLDAEIRNLYAADRGGPFPMDWRRLRRAEARVTRTAAAIAARSSVVPGHVCDMIRLVETGMLDCRYGCKVMTCPACTAEFVVHFATYGCPDGRRQVVELMPAADPHVRRSARRAVA
jgi:hypothetical protein